MTTYTVSQPSKGRLPMPEFDPYQPTSVMRRALEQYVQQVESRPHLCDIDCESMGYDRPGLDPNELVTDLEYARLLLLGTLPAFQPNSGLSAASDDVTGMKSDRPVPASNHVMPSPALPANAAVDGLGSWGPPKFGPLVLHDGFALMNSQVLRSRVFQSPPLDTWMRALGDSSNVQLKVGGFSPSADHYLILLFVISQISKQPDPRLGAAVQFSTGRLIAAYGWARNSRTYERVSRLIEELKRVRLTFKNCEAYQGLTVVSDAPLFAGVTEGQRSGKTEQWQVVLTPSLLQLFGLGRNTLLEMRACRALNATPSAVWLYGFIASQKPGVVRKFDVRAICAACGLIASREVDNRKALRHALEKLQAAAALPGGPQPNVRSVPDFKPILDAWALERTARGWVVSLTRSNAFSRQA